MLITVITSHLISAKLRSKDLVSSLELRNTSSYVYYVSVKSRFWKEFEILTLALPTQNLLPFRLTTSALPLSLASSLTLISSCPTSTSLITSSIHSCEISHPVRIPEEKQNLILPDIQEELEEGGEFRSTSNLASQMASMKSSANNLGGESGPLGPGVTE